MFTSSGVNSSAASISLLVRVPSPFTSILMKALWTWGQRGKYVTKNQATKLQYNFYLTKPTVNNNLQYWLVSGQTSWDERIAALRIFGL